MFSLRFRTKFVKEIKKLSQGGTPQTTVVSTTELDDSEVSTKRTANKKRNQLISGEPSSKKLKKNVGVGKNGAGPKCVKEQLHKSRSNKRKADVIRARSRSGEFVITDQPSTSNTDSSNTSTKRPKNSRPAVKKPVRPHFVVPTQRVLRSAKQNPSN